MEPPFFELRLAERRDDFLLPPFFAEAFLREERLLGAMVRATRDYGAAHVTNFKLRGGTPEETNEIKKQTRTIKLVRRKRHAKPQTRQIL